MSHSFKPEGGTLWLHQILQLYWESIDTAINYSNVTFLVIHLNYSPTCHMCMHYFQCATHLQCNFSCLNVSLLLSFLRDGKLNGIDLLNEIKCILYVCF